MVHLRTATLLLCGLLATHVCLHAQNATMLIAQGDSLLEAARASKAMAKYNAAVAIAPSADALAGRARGWYYQGKYDKFLTDIKGALALDSLHPQANYQRALDAARTNDNTAVIHFTTQAIGPRTHAGLRRQALILRGEAEAATGQNEQAVADLRAGIDDRLDDAPAMKLLARLLDEAGDPAASLEVLEKLCAVQPADIGNWSNRGFELTKLERYEEAVDVLDKALVIDKDEPVVLSNKAYALLKLNRDEEALTVVGRSLKADATNPYALRTRALLYLRKGERAKACDDLTLAKAMGGAPEVDELIKQHCSGMPGKR